ncbi:MAG TPA: anti-sigma factor [Gaiellales bacterium]|nr:anti-sigma factor [Gaiellales bacterium]
MTGEPEFESVERLLQSVPAPLDVPPGAAEAARAAALQQRPPREAVVHSPRRPRLRSRRLVPAALVLVAAAAASLVIGVGGRSAGTHVQQTVALVSARSDSASGSLALSSPSGAMRAVVLSVKGLPPAPAGHYYEMWMGGKGTEAVGMMVFQTNGSGKVTVRSEVPSGMTWTRCWVTLEDSREGAAPVPVLTSSA